MSRQVTKAVSTDQIFEIQGGVKHYLWGQTADRSLVRRLWDSSRSTDVSGAASMASAKGEEYWAELWFGDHPSADTVVLLKGAACLLREFLASRAPSSQLNFLLKVLSVKDSLSVQLHPQEDRASGLHTQDPVEFPDPFGKAEFVVALSPATLLWGFVTPQEFYRQLQRSPVLAELFGALLTDPALDYPLAAMRVVLDKISDREQLDLVAQHSMQLSKSVVKISAEDRVFLTLVEQHGAKDRGVWFAYLMNLVSLEVGQGIFTPPGVLHSYLSGDLVELMLPSDNVVRAGLTVKPRRVGLLLELVEERLRSEGASGYSFKPRVIDGSLAVLQCEPSHGIKEYDFCVQTSEESGRSSPLNLNLFNGCGAIALANSSVSGELLLAITAKGELSTDTQSFQIKPGSAFLVTAECPHYTIRLEEGKLFRAGVKKPLVT